MTNYPPRKANKANLVVGINLVFVAINGLTSAMSNFSGSNLTGALAFILVFMFMGGYEIGKYAEN